MKFDCILADPPWKFNPRKGKNTKFGGGAEAHYPVMTKKEILGLGPLVESVSNDNCLLALWICMPILPLGLEVIKAWGFKYSTTGFTWIKIGKNGKPITSPGYYTGSNAEVVLFGTKTNKRFALQPKVKLVNSVVFERRMKHSKKPEEVQNRLDLMYPDFSKLEMFARRHREGYFCTGLDLDHKDIRDSLREIQVA